MPGHPPRITMNDKLFQGSEQDQLLFGRVHLYSKSPTAGLRRCLCSKAHAEDVTSQ